MYDYHQPRDDAPFHLAPLAETSTLALPELVDELYFDLSGHEPIGEPLGEASTEVFNEVVGEPFGEPISKVLGGLLREPAGEISGLASGYSETGEPLFLPDPASGASWPDDGFGTLLPDTLAAPFDAANLDDIFLGLDPILWTNFLASWSNDAQTLAGRMLVCSKSMTTVLPSASIMKLVGCKSEKQKTIGSPAKSHCTCRLAYRRS